LSLIAAATFLFWKQSSLRSLASTVAVLPEQDRLERIRIDYGVRPKGNVAAADWLKSRRQELLFWGYASTLLVALLLGIIVLGHMVERPGGVHRAELQTNFATLRDRLEAYVLSARNLRDAFTLAGENAIAPDGPTAQILTERIERYNSAYGELRTRQTEFLTPVLSRLQSRPDLVSEINGLVQFALEDLHQAGILQFNDAAYRRTQQLRALPKERRAAEERLIRSEGALEIQRIASKVDGLLDVLSKRLQTVSAQIL
jgi:hypothetical protein